VPRPLLLIRGLAAACHPGPSVAVTTVAVLLAVVVDLRAGRVVLLGAAILTGQLSIGWSNDRIDAARDTATGRRDKPAASGLPLDAIAIAAGLALGATVVLSLLLGLAAATAALLGVAAGWAYNLGLKASVFSAVTYLIAFAALPAVPYFASPGHPWPPWWAPVAGGLLGVGAHFANVIPDLRADAATGVRGLPQRLGLRRSVMVTAGSLAAASIVLGFGPGQSSILLDVTVAALGVAGAVAAAAAAARRPETATAFRITMLMALLDVTVLILRTK
jgi:4-hydroxybenzoate polyprenyltransferase